MNQLLSRSRILLLFLLCFRVCLANEQWNPQADSAAIVVSGKARFTILTSRLIRIQYSSTSKFEDRATFAVVNRRLPVPRFTQRTEDGYLIIETDSLTLRYKVGSAITATQKNSKILGITFNMNGRTILWYPGKDDAMNLLGTQRTLDGDIGDTHRVSLEKGLLSRDGWAILDESPQTKRGDGSCSFPFGATVDGIPWVDKPIDSRAIDWYFLGYGHQYKEALGDYVRIAGRQPLPPLYMFGYWYSKYQAYSQSEFQQIVKDMESKKVPHDVLMLDCDWHQNSWTGWTWNKSLIPTPKTLLSWMHTHNTRTALNLHPADGIGSSDDNFSKIRDDMGLPSDATTVPWQLEDSTFYRTFFKNIIRVRENEGVDFWWLDWQQDKTSSYIAGLGHTFWLNHVFYNDMRLNHPDRRPVVFHRWGGMGSHRYPLGFSGDTFATFGTLRFESYYTATSANVCFGYWGHDGGGYLQPNDIKTDPELVLRWMQFCAFQPIFRTHGSSQSGCERRIWKFSNFNLQNQVFQFRYSLVPYIYTAAREAYDTGVSICRPLYYEWPEENRSYTTEDEYLFGSQMLVAPISTPVSSDDTSERDIWLPEGEWFDVCRGYMREGETRFTDQYALNEIPYFIRGGSIIPTYEPSIQHLKKPVDKLVLWVIPGTEGEGRFYEDHGDNEDYRNGAFAITRFSQQRGGDAVTLTIAPREGSYEGMPESRDVEVQFWAQEKPYQVTIDGQEVAEWTYDEVLRRLTLQLPNRACSKETAICLYANATDIAAQKGSQTPILRYQADRSLLQLKSDHTVNRICLSVVDLSGRELLHQVSAHTTEAQLSLSSLPTGEYVCRANADGFVVTRKIIKL